MDASLQERLSRYLPTHLASGLDQPPVMTQAIQHLNSLQKALASFLPLYIEDDVQGDRYSALRPGTFLFADVAGFTALSERLQRASSSEGAEVLTLIINNYFAEMLEILAKSDGQLLKFAGDALLAFFPAKQGDISDALKAVRTGLRMQRAMKQFQPITDPRLVELIGTDRPHALLMSIGMARGKLFEALVGNAEQRDHIVQGDLPGAAMHAESVGEKDEVIVDAKLAALVVGHFSVKRMEQGFSRIVDSLGGELGDYEFEAPRKRRAKTTSLFDLAPDYLMETLRGALERVEAVAPYVAPAVLQELIVSENYHLRSENRFTVMMFIHASGFAEMLREWGESRREQVVAVLERYYDLVQRAITSRGGTLARTDPYRSGIKLLATFGAPVAHPDDPDRAVDAALDIRAKLAELNAALLGELPAEFHRQPFIEQHIGITQGNTFASEVGWKARREYTVMGDDVNLAARLMSKAGAGQIIISERVYRRVETRVEVETLAPMQLKGKETPVQAYSVLRQHRTDLEVEVESGSPLIGREALLEALVQRLTRTLESGEPLSLALAGYNGTGKTRVARYVARSAEAMGFRSAWVTCSSGDDDRAIFRSLVEQLLETTGEDAAERLREAPNDLLPTTFVTLLARKQPILIVIDDLHRANPHTLDTLRSVVQSVEHARLAVIVIYEPPLPVDLGMEMVLIPDLSRADSGRLAAHLLHVDEPGARLEALLWDKARGRPLYIESLLQHLRANESVIRGELKENAETDILPDALRELVMSRVDSCPPDAQIVLRAAAILGDSFTPESLSHVSELADLDRVHKVLGYLVENHMIEAVDGWRYTFRHDLTRGAIYGSLARSLRMKLHRQAANYWRAHRGIKGQPYRHAQHLMKCGLLPQAIEVLSNAGEEAEKRGDTEEAIALYRHALSLLPDEKSIAARLEALGGADDKA
ncbi:MAG: AAA family ATPase [Anaerolinea sp.]|nr:AAA family ATPase [Anaerolinea sp.]